MLKMKTMKRSLLLAFCAATLLFSCGEDDDFAPCNDFKVGDSITVPGTTETLLVDAVYQDNRCPCNALCITAGGIGYRLITPSNDTLLIGRGDQTVPADSLQFNGRVLRLVNVSHRDICDPGALTQADYCADFRFQ